MSAGDLGRMLEGKKLAVCVGTGGVGKTTTAAALALREAGRGKKVLAITVDPSKRLASTLNISMDRSEPARVADPELAGALFGVTVNAEEIFDRFLSETMRDAEKIERLKKNRLYNQLKTRLSGSQEFTSLELLHECVQSGEYDLVVLDTPPAQNAIEFLQSPQRLHRLFDSSVTKWFLQTPGDAGFLKKLILGGGERVLSALETLTGRGFIAELRDFFQLAQHWQQELSERMKSVHRLLTGTETLFIMVTAFDEAKLDEALQFESELKRQGYPFDAVIVNRLFPLWMECGEDEGRFSGDVASLHARMRLFYGERLRRLRRFHAAHGGKPTFYLPEFKEAVSELQGLKEVAARLRPLAPETPA